MGKATKHATQKEPRFSRGFLVNLATAARESTSSRDALPPPLLCPGPRSPGTPIPCRGGGGGGGGCGSQSTFPAAGPVAALSILGRGRSGRRGNAKGAHPPESFLCDWGVAGGSSRSAELGLRGRREGTRGPQPGAPRRARPLRPPGPGPAFRGAGAARAASGRPVSADRSSLPGSGGGRAAACRGHGEEGAPRGRGWSGACARAADRRPGEAGAPRARRRGVALPSRDASDSRFPKPEEEV